MLRLVKAFWEIATWRRSPANLPSSVFLLGLVAAAAAVLELVGALLPPNPSRRVLARILFSVGLPLVFAWTVLAAGHRRQRFLQTGTALLGVGVLLQLLLYPLQLLLSYAGPDSPASVPEALALLVGLVWYVLACSNIWRAALDSGLGLGSAISVGYILLSFALEQLLLVES